MRDLATIYRGRWLADLTGKGQSPVVPLGYENPQEVDPAWPPGQGRQIRQYMDFVLVRDDYTRAKPDPEPYLTALSRFGAPGEEALVVEDPARGLRSAIAAGIDCAVVCNEFTKSHDFSQAHYGSRPRRS